MSATAEEKVLLYSWVASQFCVLVPKRRGSGFLKVPYGHHINSKLESISSAVACDVFGLDGMLEFDCGGSIYHDEVKRLKFSSVVVPLLQSHYGFSAREVSASEFWKFHPTPGSSNF